MILVKEEKKFRRERILPMKRMLLAGAFGQLFTGILPFNLRRTE